MSDKIEVSKELLDPDKCDFIEKHLSRKECGTCGKAILADSERVWVCMCDLNRPTSWPPTAPPAETTEDAMEDARAFYQKRFPNFPTSDDYTFQILAEFAEQYATKQIERFVEEVETEMLENENITSVLGLAADLSLIMRKVSKTRTNSTEIEGDINQ